MTFYELEKLCKKRRIKKRFFLFFIILLIIILFVAIVYLIKVLFVSDNNIKKENITRKNIQKTQTVKTKQIIKQIPVKEVTIPININTNDKINHKYVDKNSSAKENETKKVILKPFIVFNENNNSSNNSLPTVKKDAKNNISIKNENIIVTQTMPSYDRCIYLAKKALNKGDYSSALMWAKNANYEDKSKPEAWIISAKALYKEGKKQKAIEILKLYLKFKQNEKIKKLLKELEK